MSRKIFDTGRQKRFLGRKFWNLLSKLPLFIKGPLIRTLFSVDSNFPKGLVFKRAETYDEVQQAFKVAYEGFVERGLISATENQMRVTKHHALPSTVILIAKMNDEVVATMSVIVDSQLGLPLEKLWSVDHIKLIAARSAEISTLAIKKSFRSQRGRLLLPLCKLMIEFCTGYLGVDLIFMAVHPEIMEFYRSVVLATLIDDGEPKSYSFVQGAPAVGLYIKLDNAFRMRAKKTYDGKSAKRNLYKFFFEDVFDEFVFPKRSFYRSSYSTFTPDLLEYFFVTETEVLDNMSAEEKAAISNVYFYPEFKSVLGIRQSSLEANQRTSPRGLVLCKSQFYKVGERDVFAATVLEVSREGLRLRLPSGEPGQIGSKVFVSLAVSPKETISVHGVIAWHSPSTMQVGIKLDKEGRPLSWLRFIKYVESDLLGQLQQVSKSKKRAS